MNDKVIKTASSKYQKFSLVYGLFGDKFDKYEYAIKYAVGTSREAYKSYGSENLGTDKIKTWKTITGATKAWSKYLQENGAVNEN